MRQERSPTGRRCSRWRGRVVTGLVRPYRASGDEMFRRKAHREPSVSRGNHAPSARSRPWRVALAVLGAIGVAALLGGGAAYAVYRYDVSNADRILPGISIADIDVGGMTEAEAVYQVEVAVAPSLETHDHDPDRRRGDRPFTARPGCRRSHRPGGRTSPERLGLAIEARADVRSADRRTHGPIHRRGLPIRPFVGACLLEESGDQGLPAAPQRIGRARPREEGRWRLIIEFPLGESVSPAEPRLRTTLSACRSTVDLQARIYRPATIPDLSRAHFAFAIAPTTSRIFYDASLHCLHVNRAADRPRA